MGSCLTDRCGSALPMLQVVYVKASHSGRLWIDVDQEPPQMF